MNAKETIFSRGTTQASGIVRTIALMIVVQITLAASIVRADFFINTGSMPGPRYYHTASLLGNGKVLVAGGYGTSSVLPTAALYDPGAGTWAATGSLPVGRYLHTATVLTNGKVLVVGGYTNGALASTALYDPATGTWTASGSLITARYYHTASLLQNGKVLVTGGYNSNYVLTAELYDPGTGTWTAAASMPEARYLHTATVLQSGWVLIAGGSGPSGFVTTARVYNTWSGTWQSAGTMPDGRYYHSATLLPNGKALVAAGYGSSGVLSSAAVYDPGAGTWTTTGSLNASRYFHAAALLPDGKVLACGGYGSVSSAEIYNPATGAWSVTGALKNSRYSHTATTLSDGRVLVAGGSGSSGVTSSAELFIPTVSNWTTTGSMGIEHEFHTATLLPNGKVLVAGGWINTTVTGVCELYDPRTGTWTTTGSLPSWRYLHTATLLANGKVLVVGGYGVSVHDLSTPVYDPAAGTWSAGGSLPHGRHYHTMTLLPNGKVLLAGGTTNSSMAFATALLYDPATGTWTATGSMINARMLHTATLLSNGKVLVAGGSGATAELYDPATGTWTATGSMPVARSSHTAAVLTNGKVLVAGGLVASSALYDPALGTWTTTGSMYVPRYYHQMVTLPDGKVMVVGGLMSIGYNTPSCEIYDPVTGTWSPTGSLNKGRYDHTATALANGKVLVAGGGRASYEPMPDCEIYAPLLIDPKSSGGFAYSTVTYASTGTQYIARYQSPSSGFAINRRVDISPFYNAIDPTWGFDASEVPINGILKVPTGSGPFPLALFVHGNHDPFDFSDEGYIYLCEVLASWGILAGTIDANFLNGWSWGENGARGILHLEHVKQFEIWHTTSGHALYGKVNFTNIMIVGHSRGGEGVSHASYYNTYAGSNPVALDGSAGLGPYGFNLTAVVGIAPTDGQYVPPEGVQPVRDNYMIIHGSRDADVSDFQGYQTYDRAHPVDITPPIDNAEGYKALLWSIGANHNYFNSTWDNEWGAVPTLTRTEQENVAKVYIGGMAQASLLNRPRYLELLKNYEVGKNWLPSSSSALFISQYQDAIRQFIDHYEEDSNTATLSPPSSGTNTWSAASFTEMFFSSGWDVFQETYGVNLNWSSSTHHYQAAFSSPGLNLGGYPYFAVRIGQSTDSENPVGADQNLTLLIQDTSGGRAFYTARAFPRLLYPDTWNTKMVMQTIRIPMSLIRDRVNVKNIALVKLVFDQVSTGNVYFDELQISN